MIMSAKGCLEEDLSFALQRRPSIKQRKTSSETSVYTVRHQAKHLSAVFHQRDSGAKFWCERSCRRNW